MNAGWELLWPYRAVLAVDAANFSAQSSKVMGEINADIQRLLASALGDIGLAGVWQRRQFGAHTGDGYLAGLEPETLPGLVGAFPESLRRQLIDHQDRRPDLPALQLRVSIHVGPLKDTGLGDPMVHTHRLLDDGLLRRLLKRADPKLTPTAVIISNRVYEDVFRSGLETGAARDSDFRRRIAKVKTFEQPAWVHVPGLDWGLVDKSLVEELDVRDAGGVSPVPEPAAPSSAASAGVVMNQTGGHQPVQGYNVTSHYAGGGTRD
jgi:hypothetical protein